MRCDCPLCADRVARRRGDRAIGAIGAAELGVLVITFPPEFRPFMDLQVLQEIESRMLRTVRAWSRAALGGDVGGRSAWHPTGDVCGTCGRSGPELGKLGKCPCGANAEYKPHLNIVFPAVVRTESGDMKRRHLYLTRGQLDLLRAAVNADLAEAAEVLGLSWDPKRLNLFWQYRRTKQNKRHALRYFLRPFPAWSTPRPRVWGLTAGPSAPAQAYRAAVACPEPPATPPACPCCGQAQLAIYVARRDDGLRARQVDRRWEEILAEYGS